MTRSPRQAAASATAPKWLTPAQLEAWQALTLMLARLPTALEAQLQRDSQLSYIEYYALAGLSEQPDRTMRMSELAVLTNAELSRLSHLITRLQKRGYVRREPDPDDGRYTNAVLTDAGYDLVVAAAPGHVAAVRELVIDALDDTALKTSRKAPNGSSPASTTRQERARDLTAIAKSLSRTRTRSVPGAAPVSAAA